MTWEEEQEYEYAIWLFEHEENERFERWSRAKKEQFRYFIAKIIGISFLDL
jgi:hypothetical protein